MKKAEHTFFQHLVPSFVIAGISLLLMYTIVYFWKRDGFDNIEISLLSIIAFIILLPTTIICDAFFINKYRALTISIPEKPIKKIFSVFIVFFLVLFIMSAIDFIFFFGIDDSLSYEYASELELIMKNSGMDTKGIKDFYRLPFFIQNIGANIAGLLLGSLISLFFIKKDGYLLN
ncbi:MAG: hypothetical protein LBE36_01855 [Flavobacteriaceae bacterium]|nr:hypothetical protein [Flavobacteriaceae bacterium]